jgi:hypothetical protein
MALSRAMRSSMGGWVLKRLSRLRPDKGLTINMKCKGHPIVFLSRKKVGLLSLTWKAAKSFMPIPYPNSWTSWKLMNRYMRLISLTRICDLSGISPTNNPDSLTRPAQDYALTEHKALDFNGYSRTDDYLRG